MAKKDDISRIYDKMEQLSKAETLNTANIANMKQSLESLDETLKKFYVTNDRFEPVKTLVYGLAGGVLATVLGAILATYITAPSQITVSTKNPETQKVIIQEYKLNEPSEIKTK